MARKKETEEKRLPPWAERLQSARVMTGMNPTEFARACGMSQQRYHNYETGKQKPNLEGLAMLSTQLGEDIYFIITGTRPRSRPE